MAFKSKEIDEKRAPLSRGAKNAAIICGGGWAVLFASLVVYNVVTSDEDVPENWRPVSGSTLYFHP